MFARTVQRVVPQCTQVRGMATLKEIRMRLKSVTNIQKITKSMKMVSAAKYSKAERELKIARPYGEGATVFCAQPEFEQDETKPAHIILAMTSDRGLCGAVHSNIVKAIKAEIESKPEGTDTKLVLIGDKSRSLLAKTHSASFLLTFNEIGRIPPVFEDAAKVAMAVLESGYEFEFGTMFYNRFKSVVSYKTSKQPVLAMPFLTSTTSKDLYDSADETILQNFIEFNLASLIYFGLKEGSCSELSSRMTAMESATQNAEEMIDKLTLTFNRTRQAAITRELIEIISGAAAI